MTIQLANLLKIEQRKQGVQQGLVVHLKSACTLYFIHNCFLCIPNALRQLITARFMQCGYVECSPMLGVSVLTTG